MAVSRSPLAFNFIYLLDKKRKIEKKVMRESNTGHKNITYDAARDRYRCEMRVGKISRTARCKSLADALEIRDAWAKERDQLGARGAKMKTPQICAIFHTTPPAARLLILTRLWL